jgi:hypothetical protein
MRHSFERGSAHRRKHWSWLHPFLDMTTQGPRKRLRRLLCRMSRAILISAAGAGLLGRVLAGISRPVREHRGYESSGRGRPTVPVRTANRRPTGPSPNRMSADWPT